MDTAKSVLLLLEVPRNNDKKELSAEQMFATLHGILKSGNKKWFGGTSAVIQDSISFEIAVVNKRILFYIFAPKPLQTFIEGQVYAQYPTAQIFVQTEDYAARSLAQPIIHTINLVLNEDQTIPIKTFPSFEVDPLAAITATLAKLEQSNEEMWIQVLAKPVADDWHKKSAKHIAKLRSGTSGGGLSGYAAQIISAPVKPPVQGETPIVKTLSEREQSQVAAITEKSQKLGYEVGIRVLYAGNDQTTATLRMQALVGAFKQFNSTNLNGFKPTNVSFDNNKIGEYRSRLFPAKPYILNIEELASIYHLPHTSVETPNVVWASSKTGEPPSSLPAQGFQPDADVSLFGATNFRGENRVFGTLRKDRSRHFYIIGQTGTGKSGLLELMALSDVFYNEGYAIIDPHGDFAVNNMSFIPQSRIEDVVYFNPSDVHNPVGFNPLEINNPSEKGQISSELIGVMKRMFGDSWGPRLEYILRNTLLALLDYPNSTMLDITRMLTDKNFRKDVVSHVDDVIVSAFWKNEFASWNDKFVAEAVAPVLNKVGAFTSNPIVRNIIGQPKSSFNVRQIMDEGKILIVNLSKGLIGEDNAAILGAMMVTKVQLAAMSRANIANVDNRRPFYLYVDEFQNFATDSFAVILSEARKYGLTLTVANQYISQMSEEVRGAVFGNVGSLISFRTSPEDASFLQKYFEPFFESSDIIQLANRTFITSMTINGEKAQAFSGKTLMLPKTPNDLSAQIIERSRAKYSKPKDDVELAIAELANKHSLAGQNTGQGHQGQQRQQGHGQKQNQGQNQSSAGASQANKQASNQAQQPNAQANQATNGSQPSQAPAVDEQGNPIKKKRKRKRSRKKKNKSSEIQEVQQ